MEISIFYKLIGFYSNNIKFCCSNINKFDWPWYKDSEDSISSKLQGEKRNSNSGTVKVFS